MTIALAAALDAFYLELNGGAEGDCVWMTCSCGAVLVRVVTFSWTPRPPSSTEIL